MHNSCGTGTGFVGGPNANLSVVLGSTPCHITASSPSSLDCISGPWQPTGAQTVFPGGRGVRVETWGLEAEDMVQLTFPGDLPSGPAADIRSEVAFSSARQGPAFIQRLSAVFTAPATGEQGLAVCLTG